MKVSSNKVYNSTTNDVSKHILSLRARLGFARFKMKQGWEASTLLDVEQLWKQKQRQSMNELPKPRFTQRDIIDKRSYIPSPGARYAKSKKAKLVRTYSNPSIDSNKSTLYFHHYKVQQEKKNNDDNYSYSGNNSEEEQQPLVRNSLDYLSYAIAMTEREECSSSQPLPDISLMEPNLIEKESPPSSPITSAAKAIMMFVNNNQSNN